MKNNFKEKHKLPLTFKNVTKLKINVNEKRNSNTLYFLECERCQTNFYIREKPLKFLTRFL